MLSKYFFLTYFVSSPPPSKCLVCCSPSSCESLAWPSVSSEYFTLFGFQFISQSIVILFIHLCLYIPHRDSIPRTAVSLLIHHPVQLDGFEGKFMNKTTVLECISFRCQEYQDFFSEFGLIIILFKM